MADLRLGDCLQVMEDIPDHSVDMILCDLPYGTTRSKSDKRLSFPDLWRQYKRIIKDNGCIALFGQGLFYADLVHSNRKQFRYEFMWDKVLVSGFLNANLMPLRRHELIAIFYKKPPTYNPQFSEGKPLHSKGKAYKDKTPTNNNYGDFKAVDDSRAGSTKKYPTSILQYPNRTRPSQSTRRKSRMICASTLSERTRTREKRYLITVWGAVARELPP